MLFPENIDTIKKYRDEENEVFESLMDSDISNCNRKEQQ